MKTMVLIAAAVFAADLLAACAIVASFWIEAHLGLSHGLILDWVFVVAVCFGVAAWIAGEAFMRDLLAPKKKQDSEGSHELPPLHAVRH